MDNEFYNELSQAADQAEITSTLQDMEDGDEITFPNGATVVRHGDQWEVTAPAAEPSAPPTAEQSFRSLLRGE